MTAELGEGRYGPVFLGIDTDTGQHVVIRTFAAPMPPDGRERFLEALTRLCEMPLDHAAIASPLACGEVDGVPFLVHAFAPGQPLDEYLRDNGRRSLSEVSLRVMHLAGAIDFAAAASVVHGSLGPRDLLLDQHRTGIAGFGIAQALFDAGLEPRQPSTADDLYALAALTYELLVGERYGGGGVREALLSLPLGDDVDVDALSRTLESALSSDPAGWPTSALQFAASLHDALLDPSAAAEAAAVSDAEETLTPVDAIRLHPAAPASKPAPPVAVRVPAEPDGPTEPGAFTASRTLPLLFDAPMRAAEPPPFAAAAASASIAGDADLPLRDDDAAALPLRAEQPHGSRGMFVPPSPPPRGAGRVWVAGIAVVVLVLAAVFLLQGSPTLFERMSGLPAATPPSIDDSAVIESGASASGGGAAAPDAAIPSVPPGGGTAPATPPPVLSDGPIAERDVAAAPAPESLEPSVTLPGSAASAAVDRPPPPSSPSSPPALRRPSGAPPATAAPPEPSGSTGRVLVRSDPPGAQLLIDDVPRGHTPVAIRDLPLGMHTITVNAPGFPVWRQEITLTSDRPSQSFEIALGAGAARGEGAPPPPAPAGPATLEVDSRPTGARVWIDGRFRGTTPLQLSDMEAGLYAVRLELSGYRPWTTSVSVARGARARVAASLEQ